ncbi:MAG: hypothetical protein ABWY03_03005 [Microbacterium sp.]
MHEIDRTTQDELRALRARAYGPSADIHRDPSAAERLRELESRTATPVEDPAQVAEETMDAAPPPPTESEPPAATVESDAASSAPADPQPVSAPRRIPLLVKVLWALSVAAAAAAAAGITFALTFVQPVSDYGTATQIATLEESATARVPTGYMGAGPSTRAFEYFGYTIFETAGGYSYFGAQGSDCFVMVPTDQIPDEYDAQTGFSIDFTVYSGCGAGGFPAAAQLTTGAGSPAELRAQFPDDSALRFVFDGERVGVFLAED